jgi:hypothetical protein
MVCFFIKFPSFYDGYIAKYVPFCQNFAKNVQNNARLNGKNMILKSKTVLEVFMEYLLYVFPFFFLFYAIYFLYIGLRAAVKNEPSIINSKLLFALIALSLLPAIVVNIINLFEIGNNGITGLILAITPIFLIIILIFYYFIIKGYSIYCVNDTDFRNAIIFSLNNNSIKFEEKMNKIELTDLGNELNISFTAWIGAGMIKLKNKKDEIVFTNIIESIKRYFNENNIKAKKTIAVFYIIFGIMFVIFSIGFIVFLINIRRYYW